MGRFRAGTAAVALVGLTVFALLGFGSIAPAASTDPFTFGAPAFCAPKEPVRDFGLSHLPKAHELPESGEELGHGAVDMYGGWTRVMPRPTSFGYGFSEHNYSGTVLLNWTVTAQLWAVDRTGKAFEEVDSGVLSIGRLSAAHQPNIYLDPPKGRRGFYRFDLQIADASGAELGAYDAYFKVVRPFWNTKLGLSQHRVHPGQKVLSRLENFGSESIEYGEEFSVQRYEAGRWEDQADLMPEGWLMWAGILGPGGAGQCNSVKLPADASPGRYRIVKPVEPGPRGRKPIELAAAFTVTG